MEQEVLVYLSSGDEGGCSGTKHSLCTCHHVMRVDVVEQKVLVNLLSGDEGGCSGTKHSCGPVTT